MSFFRFIKKYRVLFIFLICISYIFLLRPYTRDLVLKDFDVLVGIGLVIYATGESFFSKIKQSSPQVVGQNDHFSFGGVPFHFFELGLDFLCFRRGGYESELLGISQGNEGLVVVPKNMAIKCGRNYVYKSVIQEVEFEDLPLGAKNYVESENIRPPYFLGYIPSYSFYPKGLSIKSIKKEQDDFLSYGTILQEQIKSYNRVLINFLDVIKGRNKLVIETNIMASEFAHAFNKEPKKDPDLKKLEK